MLKYKEYTKCGKAGINYNWRAKKNLIIYVYKAFKVKGERYAGYNKENKKYG